MYIITFITFLIWYIAINTTKAMDMDMIYLGYAVCRRRMLRVLKGSFNTSQSYPLSSAPTLPLLTNTPPGPHWFYTWWCTEWSVMFCPFANQFTQTCPWTRTLCNISDIKLIDLWNFNLQKSCSFLILKSSSGSLRELSRTHYSARTMLLVLYYISLFLKGNAAYF